jgi:GTP pyrophosphokinase
MELPAGSTPLDFAFKIHSAVGYKCVGAKINGKMVTIDHILENGDIIEIVTSPNAAGPSIDWLKIAKSSSARNKIRQWLKKENKTDNIDKGKDHIDKYMRKKGYDPRILLKNAYISRVVKELGYKNAEDLYAQLSAGGAILTKVTNILLKYDEDTRAAEEEKSLLENLNAIHEKTEKKAALQEKVKRKTEDNSGVVVEGVDNLMIRIAKCCSPVPGDEIVGFITKGRGITVHRKDCDNLKSLPDDEKARCIDVRWEADKFDRAFNADITLVANDQKGLLSNISKVCDDMGVNIQGINARAEKDESFKINITLAIQDKSQVEKICRSLKSIPGIMEAYRSKI